MPGVSRFAEPQHPVFQQLNASIGFDYRLGPYDVEQSRAHAGMLAATGIISDADRDALLGGLDRVEAELDGGTFPFRDDDEDIHMAIERRLTEIVGPVGGKLHTARSRNDQVATDMAMFTRAHALGTLEKLQHLQSVLVQLAERHEDWAMPGYTHLQRAQPIYLAHHLLAYFWMFRRDARRFEFVLGSTSDLPLGAGALAGVNFATDRRLVASDLGFSGVAPNSVDAVSNRDFVLDFLAAAATCSTHLSRLGAEIVLWSSEEFGFARVSDAWASGSSIMPQKKNPDAAELLRAKAPRVVARLAAFHGVLHGLPLTYNKDLQEDKEHLFDAVDTLDLCLQAAAGMLEGIAFDRERLAGAAADELTAATDIADLLVRRGVPFRQSHGIVAGLVREALESGRPLSGLSREDLARHSEALDDEFYAVLAQREWLESKVSEGGTALARVREQLEPRPRGARSPARVVLPREFYARPVVEVARDLIGCTLAHRRSAGVIVETEAYHETEAACHAHVGLTARTHVLFRRPGTAYVYRSYGIHALVNAVCEPEGTGAAVLIRALEPVAGIAAMRERRGVHALEQLCSGPGKLTQALGIDLELNATDLVRGPIRAGPRPPGWESPEIVAGTRIGITKAAELPWRFCATGSRSVSRPWPAALRGRGGSGR